jgi:hypothetical protein
MLKADYIQGAYEQLRIWGLTSSVTPVESELALKRLNGLLLHWENQGIYLGWNIGADDVNDESGLPDWAQEAVFTNLAIKLMPVFGKTASREQAQEAAETYEAITLKCYDNMEYPDTMPVGAGNQRYGYSSRRFFVEEDPDRGSQPNTGINL